MNPYDVGRVLAVVTVVSVMGIGALLATAYHADTARQSDVPVALTPAHDTTLIYRAILVPAPRPDTSLRYVCRVAK